MRRLTLLGLVLAFVIAPVAAGQVCSTEQARLKSPANGEIGTGTVVHFEWDRVAGAVEYALIVAANDGPAIEVARTTEEELEIEVPSGHIDWSVASFFGACPATVSRVFSFETGGCPRDPQRPVLLTPADGATALASPVRLTWTAVPNAIAYRVVALVNGAPQLFVTRDTSLEATFAAAATVSWQVEALFGEGCATTVSDRRSFTVAGGSSCPTAAPRLLEPANGATGVASPVRFHWTEVEGAVAYRLFIGIDGGPLQLAAQLTDTDSEQVIARPGTVAWQVHAVFLGCDPTISAVSTFTAAAAAQCSTDRATLLQPADDARLANPVTFSWQAVTGASSYRVWATSESNTWVVATTTLPTATALLPAGELEWRVESQFPGDCRPTLSEPRDLTVLAAANCDANAAPALVSPIGSAAAPVAASSPVELRWSPSAGASEYHVIVSMNGGADADIATTRETSHRFAAPAGSYSWAVVAVFPGCRPLPSARGWFTVPQSDDRCTRVRPTIISPADDSVITTAEVTFAWTAVPGAVAYRVYLKSDGPYVQIGATTATTLVRPAIPGEFEWYVEAVLPQCPSTQSEESEFRVQRSGSCPDERPRLIAPADGAQGVASPVELAWTPVAGAVRYAVVAKTSSGAPTVIGETRTETSMSAHLPLGERIEWRVIAFRAGCEPAISDDAEFTVSAPAACREARPPLLLSPPDGARVAAPVHLAWTPVTGASGYRVWASLNGERPILVASPSAAETEAALPPGSVEWLVEATFESCPPLRSSSRRFEVVPPPQTCTAPPQPLINAVGQALSDTPYVVRWTPLPGVSTYELQESSSRNDFSAARTILVENVPRQRFVYSTTTVIQKFYRVRGISACNAERGPYSEVIGVFVVPPNARQQRTPGTAEVGQQQTVVQTITVPGGDAPLAFTASADQPWLTVTPSSGTLPPEGMQLTVTADARALDLGANAATIRLTYGGASNSRRTTHAAAPVNIPVSVSLVTPVGPTGNNTPPIESLIIPAVGHAPGANNSLFQSDVRVANTSTQPLTYLLTFTPSAAEGTVNANSTTIQVDAGATVALNDILASFFGTGPQGSAIGTLEIRPQATSTLSPSLASAVSTATVASSRTYNVTEAGTLGQYIPAIPFGSFIGMPANGTRAILSLQQIAESSAYRTNLGLVEGSGQPATLVIRVYDAAGTLRGERQESLRAREHKQINSILAVMGISLDDGRIEVEPTSATGKITAYASTVDNVTNDPLLVQPVLKSAVQSTRYVIPGIAFADGLARWRSDVRVFNAGTTAAAATITFFPEGNPAASTAKEVTIAPGEILALNNVLQTFFGVSQATATGSLLISTSTPSSLVTSARTYAMADAGTYGLFAPGVTPGEAVGLNERSVHLLQLEQSTEFRTNIGLVETTGNAASVEISLIQPGALATGTLRVDLPANGFVQFPLSAFGSSSGVYNARVAVRVVSGTGHVSAYGSVVDNQTNDSTYVPAQ